MASNDRSNSANLPRGLLGRRGTPVGKEARLSSIRGPRDLTLGGSKKKTFQPNIPARREKKDESQSRNEDSQFRPSASGRMRGKKDERGRGRGRGRGEREVIQSHSIFEEGPTDRLKRPVAFADRDDRYSTGSLRGAYAKVDNKKGSSEDTKKILDHLLRDDFMVDEKLDTEDPTLAPVCLPLGNKIKMEQQENVDLKPDIKIKQEPTDETDSLVKDEDSTDNIPGRPINDRAEVKVRTAAELFSKPSYSDQGELIFFQLPDTLPGDPHATDDKPPQKSDESKEEEKPKNDHCVLSDFKEGHIGKLQIHKSGRTCLILGNTTMEVSLGTPPGFLQNLASLHLEEKSGDLTILGPVQHKILCIPDFENMLDDR